MGNSETNEKEGKKLTTRRINEMAFAFRHTGTLIAALELGLFTAVSKGASSPAKVAEETGMPIASAERLLIACRTMKLLENDGDEYVNAPDVEKYLVRGRPTYFGPPVSSSRTSAKRRPVVVSPSCAPVTGIPSKRSSATTCQRCKGGG